MKVFISWSGERSQTLARSLYDWLPGVINIVDPWLSSTDINPGTRWGNELSNELEETKYGIICITTENVNAPWILFEAGALSKYVEKSRVVPLLLDHKPADIKGPLAQFQAIQTTQSDIKKLITGINLTAYSYNEKQLNKNLLEESFNLWWPKLEAEINKIPPVPQEHKTNERSQKDIIEETLVIVRDIRRKLNLETFSKKLKSKNDTSQPPENFPPDWDEQWQPSFDIDFDPNAPENFPPKWNETK